MSDRSVEADPLLLTPREAARALSVSPRKLWGLTASGELPCVRFGRAVRYDRDDLRRLIAQRKETVITEEK